MAQRSRQQWQSLIDDFENSRLTQTAFCKSHNLNPKYFSLKRSKLKLEKANNQTVFFPVVVASSTTANAPIELSVGSVMIKLAPSISPDYLAQLIRSLA